MASSPLVKLQMIQSGYIQTEDGEFEHRAVYKRVHGQIPYGWIVHHLDYCKTNNEPENLMALPEHVHKYIHTRFTLTAPSRELIIKSVLDALNMRLRKENEKRKAHQKKRESKAKRRKRHLENQRKNKLAKAKLEELRKERDKRIKLIKQSNEALGL